MIEALFKTFQSLANPKIGRDLKMFNIELVNHFLYRQEKISILYQVDEVNNAILILRIFSNKEDIIRKIENN
ncbi:hypothetical protein RV07_GL003239 [Enterococcus malodoratus]|nr:hypothetical protein RV07_GL003239 [Enterococcus malodoratus]